MVSEGTDWARQGQPGAIGHGEFRRGTRIADKMFILQSLLKQTRNMRQRLDCCFVDSNSAFGSIPRQQLWLTLTIKVVTGPILHSLIPMYAQETACVTQKGLFETFCLQHRCQARVPSQPAPLQPVPDDVETLLSNPGFSNPANRPHPSPSWG